MAIVKEDILNAISEMSVMDVCDLVKKMEEKFGVSAQAVMPSVVQTTNSNEEKEEKSEFDVVLVSAGKNKIAAIKAVRAATELGLKEAKDAVQGAPFTVKEALPKEDAEKLKKQLEESGAEIELK